MEYEVNKGVGKSLEFKGLTSSFLSILAIGVLITFFIVIIMYMIGLNSYVCIVFGLIATTVIIWITFHLNKRYGIHGLMKIAARNKRPRCISNRKVISRLFKTQ